MPDSAPNSASVKLSILVPVYNERRTLRTLLTKLLNVNYGVSFEVIVVDDCSTDGSPEIIREVAETDTRIRTIFKTKNAGKGSAIHTAIEAIQGEIAIIQDADLEYEPNEIPRVIKPILDGVADAVFGSRFSGRETRRVLYYRHTLGNQFLTWLSNVVTDLNLTDMETCYKAVRSSVLKQIPLKCTRFGIEPELTIRLAQWGVRIFEVPISYSGRTYAEGKKITWKDGVQALQTIFWAAFIDKRFTKHDGFYVLTAVRGDGLNKWMFEQFRKFVGSDVLEAGCGIGNLSKYMLEKNSLICADIDPLYVSEIGQRFGHLENFDSMKMNLANDADFEHLSARKLDTVICLNVLEHIEDDGAVLKNFYETLEEGGRAILLVPQYQFLFSPVDYAVGHWRRYSKSELIEKMSKAGFKVVHSQGFNRFGTLGWFVNGKIFKKDTLSPHAMALFNKLLGVAKLIEKLQFLPALSIIVVGEKPVTTRQHVGGDEKVGANRDLVHS